MRPSNATAGYFRSNLPYNRFGHGPRTLVVFPGLLFENKPLAGLLFRVSAGMYTFLAEDYTIYMVSRKPGLPDGYSMQNMADDYATMMREEFGGPVDVIGLSTGGSIALYVAADHPDVVRRLVIHSSAYTLGDPAKRFQLHLGQLARQRRWRDAYAALFAFMATGRGVRKYVAKPLVWLGSLIGGRLLGVPADPADLIVTIAAEDQHDCKDRLAAITVPTLVVGGDNDPFYPAQLFRATAEGMPHARLILYTGMGHPASGKQFHHDVLTFLNAGAGAAR